MYISPDSSCDLFHKDSHRVKYLKRKSIKRRLANARERNRMHGLNSALDTLRSHLPIKNGLKAKLSKIETLKAACDYIRTLRYLLNNPDIPTYEIELNTLDIKLKI